MAASAISNLLRKNVGAGLARVSLNKNIIRNYFSLVFSVGKRAFKRRVWFDFKRVVARGTLSIKRLTYTPANVFICFKNRPVAHHV